MTVKCIVIDTDKSFKVIQDRVAISTPKFCKVYVCKINRCYHESFIIM